MDPDIDSVVQRIIDERRAAVARRSVLVALTGIDACGKGHVSARIKSSLQAGGIRTAVINVDGWLHLPERRFSDSNPAEHFYRHAFRFGPMFNDLIFPLRNRRSLRIETPYAEETATAYRPHLYDFQDVDVILLEGIYLLKREFQAYYDMSLWIECSFETALERAIARAQEGLTPEQTVAAYRKIYFPAQQIHFDRDDPKAAATVILNNDPRSTPEKCYWRAPDPGSTIR